MKIFENKDFLGRAAILVINKEIGLVKAVLTNKKAKQINKVTLYKIIEDSKTLKEVMGILEVTGFKNIKSIGDIN